MRRFTGSKSVSSPLKFFTGTSSSIQSSKELQASASSNLNSFAPQQDQGLNLVALIQGAQIVASKSNVILIAVGGIVSFIIRNSTL